MSESVEIALELASAAIFLLCAYIGFRRRKLNKAKQEREKEQQKKDNKDL